MFGYHQFLFSRERIILPGPRALRHLLFLHTHGKGVGQIKAC
jgi:hypothetical protein